MVGEWSKTEDGIRTNAVEGSRLILPYIPPREYDFRIEFTRRTGQHSIAQIFTVGNGQACFEIDAWMEHLGGLQLIDGRDMRENGTASPNRTLQNGKRYTMTVKVRKSEVQAFWDKRRIVRHRTSGDDLSVLGLWSLPEGNRSLAIGAWDSQTIFHKVEILPIDSENIGRFTRDTNSEVNRTNDRPVMNRDSDRDNRSEDSKESNAGTAAGKGRVLIVIANQHFFFREYADPREELERAGFTVEVAAGRKSDCYPHQNSGQGRDGGRVSPDFSLSQVDPDRYLAIVFSGGWGSSMYQFAFDGRYDNSAYNGNRRVKEAANKLIGQFLKDRKYVCGICHGVSVLAWARVNGQSPLDGKQVTAPTIQGPAGIYNGSRAQPASRWNAEQNGAKLVAPGSIGNRGSTADDVMVDGNIITAEKRSFR